MQIAVVLSVLCAVAVASPVAPVLLPKVNVAPAQVTVVRQPYVATQPEPVYRSVPVPLRAVTYTAPHVVPGPVITPVHQVAPVQHLAYAAPHAIPLAAAPAHYVL